VTATDAQPRDHLTIAAYRTASGHTQIQIAQLDAKGTGFGHRLAGPKHYNQPTKTLVERDLDAEDAAEIRSMLDAAFPQQSQAATPQDPEFPATWAGGHALVLEYGDEEMHGRCQCGQRFTPQRPDKPLDGFAGPWERHVMGLSR
jgi:hypothetical protein